MDAAGDALSVSPFGIISPPQATSPRSHRGPADPLLSQFHGGGHGRDATMLAAHAVMSLQKGSGLAPTSPGGMSSSTSAVAGSSSSSRPASPSLTQPSGQVYHLQRLLSEGAAPPFGTAPMSPTGAAPPAQQQQFGRQPTNPMSFGKLHHLDVILPPLGPHSSTNYSPPSPLPTISSSSRESLSSLSSSPRDTLGMSHSRESLNMSSHSREALNMSHSRESLSLSLSRESLNLSLSRESLPSLSREGLPLTPREGLPLTPRGSISSTSGGACPVPDAPPPPPFSLRLSLTNNNVVLACDGGLTQSTGYYTEDVLGSNLSDILHPADVPLMMRVLEFAQRVPDDPFTTVLRMRRRMGVDASPSYGWFEVVGRLEINPVTSRPLAVLISARALQLAVTHGTNDEFAMRHGMQGGCIEVSPSVQNVLGHDPERLRQSDIFAITHPTDGVFVQVALHRVRLFFACVIVADRTISCCRGRVKTANCESDCVPLTTRTSGSRRRRASCRRPLATYGARFFNIFASNDRGRSRAG